MIGTPHRYPRKEQVDSCSAQVFLLTSTVVCTAVKHIRKYDVTAMNVLYNYHDSMLNTIYELGPIELLRIRYLVKSPYYKLILLHFWVTPMALVLWTWKLKVTTVNNFNK